MSRHFLAVALVCAAGASTLAAEDLPRPEYRASVVCSQYVPQDGQPRLVVHAIDVTGEPIPGADVSVSQGETAVKMVRTDGKGRALFEALPIGVVHVEVAMDGFVTVRVLNLRLERGCTAAMTAPLEIGGLGGPAAP
jgi:hypothetical protein